EFEGSFWDRIDKVETIQREGVTEHILVRTEELAGLGLNDFVLDQQGFIGRVVEADPDRLVLEDLSYENLMSQQAWGLMPRDIFQALALHLLLDPDIHLVNLSGAAGSGKTILALAAAIEMTVTSKRELGRASCRESSETG